MAVELIQEVLAQHRVGAAEPGPGGWHRRCGCGWEWGPHDIRNGGWPPIEAAKEQHQAQQVWEALVLGAPEVVGPAGLVSAEPAGSPRDGGPDHGGDR